MASNSRAHADSGLPIGQRPQFTADQANRLLAETYGLEGELKSLPSYCDQNFRVRTPTETWVLKISNTAEDEGALAAQLAALEHLEKRLGPGFSPVFRRTSDGRRKTTVKGVRGQHLVHVLSYLDGRLMAEAQPWGRGQLESFGALVATIDRGMADFNHPGACRVMRWDLAQAHALRGLTDAIEPPRRRYLAERCLEGFSRRVTPRIPSLPGCVIHNDANEYNVLVADGADGPRAIAMIDFGDLVYSRRVFGLAVAAGYGMQWNDDPLTAAASVVAGYQGVWPLTDAELEVLYPSILARLAFSVTLSAVERRDRGDDPYVAISERPVWEVLERLAGVSDALALRRLTSDSAEAAEARSPGRSVEQLVAVRQRHLGPSLSLSYRRPLKMVRGWMQYLFDDTGRPFVDCVNNVCHVGHCHPRVVEAAASQMARLNTNTRYLHDHLAEYAERLTATLPDPLNVCFFVCSGSEANDLALRLARAHTRRQGVVVVDGAYHGHTGSLIGLSPYKFDGPGGQGAPDHVRNVVMPDGYRQLYRYGEPELGRKYAEHVGEAAADLERSGHGLGAFFCESALGCGGQVILPEGYLKHSLEHVRQAGGVMVLDEVQVGFGRAGTHFWTFETQDVVPDIVTLGKPIGNGHPMAAVVTTSEIARSFANGMEYFNTFGGNPVSCAVGLAVLDVLDEDDLQQHALKVGRQLKTV